jgi:hypothetical protein
MITKALPLKNLAYKFDISPTAKAPTAAEMSLWLGNLRPVKWLQTHPRQDIATSRDFTRSRQR